MTFSVGKKDKSEKVRKMRYKLPKIGLTFAPLYAKLDKSKKRKPGGGCGSCDQIAGGVRTAVSTQADT